MGWRKLDPPRSRLPVCLEALALILDRLLANGFLEEVLVTALAVHAYLRPSEAFRILARHLVPPTGSIAAWSLTLHPYEGRHPSKTEVFDEALLVGETGVLKAVATPLGQLALRRARTDPHAKLFTTTQAHWRRRRRFLSVSTEIGIPHVMFYKLRHSGASLDTALRFRSIQQVQQRGKWAAFSSVRRYEKGGRLAEQASLLGPVLLSQPGAGKAGHHACRNGHAAVLNGVRRDGRERRAPRRSTVPLPGDMLREGMPRFAKRALEIGPLRFLRVKYFLEIFAGTGRLGAAMFRRGSYTPLIDIEFGPAYDVTKEPLQVHIRGWIASGFIEAVHLGLPCDSFAKARDCRPGPLPLRSDALPMGLPDLRESDQQNVIRSNRLLKFSISLLVMCTRCKIPATLENPWTSWAWITPSMKWPCRRKEVSLYRTDFCMWGRPHRKAIFSWVAALTCLQLSRASSVKGPPVASVPTQDARITPWLAPILQASS